jgi:hypothetical protein
LEIENLIKIIQKLNINILTDDKVLSLMLLCDTLFDFNSTLFSILTIENEIKTSIKPETIYRVNSISSKFITLFCKLYGSKYLIKHFSKLINDINNENAYLEVNYENLISTIKNENDSNNLMIKNIAIISDLVQSFFDALFLSSFFYSNSSQ